MNSGFYTLAIERRVNVPVTFTPVDVAVVDNVWKVNGNIESTDLVFQKTFTAPGSYTVSHECAASCGTPCIPYSEQIEILSDMVTPSISGARKKYLWLFLGVGAAAVAGVVILSGDNRRG